MKNYVKKYNILKIVLILVLGIFVINSRYQIQMLIINYRHQIHMTNAEYKYRQDVLKIWNDVGHNMLH